MPARIPTGESAGGLADESAESGSLTWWFIEYGVHDRIRGAGAPFAVDSE